MTQTKHRRLNSLRLPGYDYSQSGYYFITICTKDRKELFGTITRDRMIENVYGKIVRDCWNDLPNHYHFELDEFIVMPNHIHGIIVLSDVGVGLRPTPTGPGLSEIIRGFKSFSARRINQRRKLLGKPVWQRNFYDHIIRAEEDLNAIREYIRFNPEKWERDRNNPRNARP